MSVQNMKHSLQNVLKKVAIKKQFEESEEDEFTQYLESLRRIKPTRFRAKLRKGRLLVRIISSNGLL